jgi:hypothetical protein
MTATGVFAENAPCESDGGHVDLCDTTRFTKYVGDERHWVHITQIRFGAFANVRYIRPTPQNGTRHHLTSLLRASSRETSPVNFLYTEVLSERH